MTWFIFMLAIIAMTVIFFKTITAYGRRQEALYHIDHLDKLDYADSIGNVESLQPGQIGGVKTFKSSHLVSTATNDGYATSASPRTVPSGNRRNHRAKSRKNHPTYRRRQRAMTGRKDNVQRLIAAKK